MNLTTRTIHGIRWSVTSQVVRLFIQFGITAILARLLVPDDFGLVAMVVVFANFAVIFRDIGLASAVVQRERLTEEHLSSGFWLCILVGLFLALALSLSAPIISRFYGDARLQPITIALAFTFFISSFGIVQTALLTRELNFKALAIIEILGIVISGVVAVFLAFLRFGVWSLVWRQIVASIVTVVLLWSVSKWRPKFVFSWKRLSELLGFGLNLTGFNFVNYFNRNLDNLLIGKFLGSLPLGFYNLAYRLLLFPLGNISSVIGKVMFPSLSAIQSDKARVRLAYQKGTRYIAVVTFPLMVGLVILAPQFVRVVFGPQWDRSIFLVRVLASVGIWQSVSSTVGWIYLSQGRTDVLLKWGLFSVCVYATSFTIGLRWNVEGVAVAYAVTALLLTYPGLAIPFRFIDLHVAHFVRQFGSIFSAAVGMSGIVLALRIVLKDAAGISDWMTLVVSVTVGVASYTGLLLVLDRKMCQEIFQLLRHLRPVAPEVATALVVSGVSSKMEEHENMARRVHKE